MYTSYMELKPREGVAAACTGKRGVRMLAIVQSQSSNGRLYSEFPKLTDYKTLSWECVMEASIPWKAGLGNAALVHLVGLEWTLERTFL